MNDLSNLVVYNDGELELKVLDKFSSVTNFEIVQFECEREVTRNNNVNSLKNQTNTQFLTQCICN